MNFTYKLQVIQQVGDEQVLIWMYHVWYQRRFKAYPTQNQFYSRKCYWDSTDGIRSLDFGEDPKSIDIYAMVSSEGERILLGKNLKARGNVENWLTAVEQNMVASLRRSILPNYVLNFRWNILLKIIKLVKSSIVEQNCLNIWRVLGTKNTHHKRAQNTP